MVFNQCRAVLLSMQAIRARIPGTRLVQTEDLGRVFSTPRLRRQADQDNQRRWLSLDLLCGRVDPAHPAWPRFAALGFGEAGMAECLGGDAVPDLIGINHYVTSDRFLDHRTSPYPDRIPSGLEPNAFVDFEASRVDLPPV